MLTAHASRLGGVKPRSKGARRELVTDADHAAEEVVVGALLEEFPEHAVLAEEGALTPEGRPNRDSDHLWIIDPLDGTTNFVHGLAFYCVAIALVHRGQPIVAVVPSSSGVKSRRNRSTHRIVP